MERQRLAECGSTIKRDCISSFYNGADPPKWPHQWDQLLDVVRSVVADERKRRD